MRDRTQASTGHGESVRTINGGAECLSSTHVSLQQHRESKSCLLAGHTRNASAPKNGYTENCDDSAVIIVPFYGAGARTSREVPSTHAIVSSKTDWHKRERRTKKVSTKM